MNPFIETLNQFGGQFLQFAWPMLWQSSLLIGFVLTLDVLLARKIRASVRYALWLVVLVKLLLPPTLALPTGAAWWFVHAQPVVKAPAIRNYTVTYDTTPQTPFIPMTVALPPPPPPQLNAAGWALLATGTISAGLLVWLAIRWRQVARTVRRATVADEFSAKLEDVWRLAGAPISESVSSVGVQASACSGGTLKRELQHAGPETGAPVRLKIVEGRMSPAVCGLFRPVILLPRTLAEQLSPAQLRAVLLHEVFHLRRKDVWVNCAQALLQIVYWWHPLLWIANARIRRVREEAVDDAVMLALRDEADSYAPTLLEVAKLAFRRPLMSLGLVGIMESRSALRQRIERLVDFRAPRKAGLTFASLCGICVFSAVALPMGEGPAPHDGDDQSGQRGTNASSIAPNPDTLKTNNLAGPTREAIGELKRSWAFEFPMRDDKTRADAMQKFAFLPTTVTEAENPSLQEAVPILIQATKDKDAMTRLCAAIALARIKSPDPRVVEALGNLATVETNLYTAALAASTLGAIGTAAASAVPILIQLLEQRNPDGSFVSTATNQTKSNFSPGTALRRAAIEALGNIGPSAKSAIPLLSKLLTSIGDFSLDERIFAAKALWQITGETRESLPVLINALEKDDSFWAADVLASMGPEAKPAIPALQNALAGGLGATRLRSAQVLSKIKPGFSMPKPLLLDLLNDKNPTVRMQATEALWSVDRDPQLILPTLLGLIGPNNQNPYGMIYEADEAIKLLGEIGPPAKAAIPRLKQISEEVRNTHVRQLATEALKKIEGVSGSSNFNAASHALEDRSNTLAEPEVVTTSGRGINKIAMPAISTTTTVWQITNQPAILINAEIFRFGAKDVPGAVRDVFSNPQMEQGKDGHCSWCSVSPEQLATLQAHLRGSGIKALMRPRIQTGSGIAAEMFIGDNTRGTEFNCLPVVDGQLIKLAVSGNIESPVNGLAMNHFTANASLRNHGGVVMRLENSDGSTASNLVVLVGVELMTNASPQLQQRSQSVLKPADKSTPQIHIKARFLEVPKGTLQGFKTRFTAIPQSSQTNQFAVQTGILTGENFKTVWHNLKNQPDVEAVAEPEVVTIGGRQTQMRATVIQTIITNFVFQKTSTNSAVIPQTTSIETGPVLDVVPNVLSDGYTVNLTLIPSLTEFLGYDDPTNTAPVHNSKGEEIDLPQVLPKFRIREAGVHINLWDGQTVVLGDFPNHFSVNGNEVIPGAEKNFKTAIKERANVQDKDLLVFVTATIVDPAGNRVHSDDELSFGKDKIPPQPVVK